MEIMVGSTSKHEWLKKKIYDFPYLALIEKPMISKTKELELYYKGFALVIPDIVFMGEDKIRYFVEVKSSALEMRYDKAMFQLENVLLWHRNYGMKEPDVRAVLTPINDTNRWIDMLDTLHIYRIGDSYGKPSGVYTRLKEVH
jgi:hypothetical protein